MIEEQGAIIFHRFISLRKLLFLFLGTLLSFVIALNIQKHNTNAYYVKLSAWLVALLIFLFFLRIFLEKIGFIKTIYCILDHEKITFPAKNSFDKEMYIFWPELQEVAASYTFSEENNYNHELKKMVKTVHLKPVITFLYKKMDFPLNQKSFFQKKLEVDELEVPLSLFFIYLSGFYNGPVKNLLSDSDCSFGKKRNLFFISLVIVLLIWIFYIFFKPVATFIQDASLKIKYQNLKNPLK